MTTNKTHDTQDSLTLFASGTPTKIALKRSTSEPGSGSKPAMITTEQSSVDDLSLLLGQQTLQDYDSLETSKPSCVFFQPIRNQCAYAIDHRLAADIQKITQAKRKQMGKLKRTDKPGLGVGGGILISEMHMLVTKHCFGFHGLERFTVHFEHLDTHTYQIEAKLSIDEAQELGLKTGENGDLMVVRLAPHEQGYPGKDNNFTILVEPANKKPAKLHFMGYTSGTSLKESTMSGRPIPITEVIERGIDASGQHATWNDFKTHGNIVKQTPEKSQTRVSIQSPTRAHDWTVKNGTVFRANGTIANAVNECYVLYPNIFSRDHVRLAHRTKGGSSGGIYFTEDGEIFAVHCGRLPSSKYYPEHLAFYPWTIITTTLYDDRLVYEKKPISLSEMLKNHLKTLQKNQYCISCADTIIGTVTTANKIGTGNQFTIQPTDISESPFTFIIPFDTRAEIVVNTTSYLRTQITFTFNPHPTIEEVITESSPALYRATLTDLEAGNATHEIPPNNQKELADRLKNNKHKHSMTHNKIRYEHITVGAAQQNGTHYEFVRENGVIAIHAIGTHRTSDTYAISQFSEAFKAAARVKGLWVDTNAKSQPLPIFKLSR